MGLDLVLVPFELRPDAPAEGLSAAAEGLRHSERVEEAQRAGEPT